MKKNFTWKSILALLGLLVFLTLGCENPAGTGVSRGAGDPNAVGDTDHRLF